MHAELTGWPLFAPFVGARVLRARALWYSRPGAPVAAVVLAARVDRDTETRFRRGEREAFLTVYAAHAPALRALVGRFFSRPFECEEAVQEVWLLVHRMAQSFDPDRGELLPWLRTLAANRCKELLRARSRRPDPRLELAESDLVAGDDPEREARGARVREAVARFEARLSTEEARVFRLSLVEGRPHDEVAAATGASPRRCKYLRMKLLVRAAADADLRAALREVTEP